MRIIETTVYFFSELGEEAQNKAIEEFSDINTNFNWYEHIITEAKELGLYIGPWDLDRHRITGHFTKRSKMIAQQILVDHGPICDTCRTAKRYLRGETSMEDFLKELLNDYLTLLKKEWEYATSRAAIVETIEANSYEFTEDGKLV